MRWNTVTSLGGAPFIETLTDAVEERAVRLMDEIDAMGGMVPAIDAGFPQREIERSAYAYQQSLERKEQLVVGVNAYEEAEAAPAVFRVDPELEREQVKSLVAFRESRDGAAVTDALDRLDTASKGTDNLFPLILDAVKIGVSVGEICKTLAGNFGRYRDTAGR